MAIGQGLRRPQNMSRLHSVVCIPVVCMHSTPSDGDRMPTAGFEQTRDPRANGVRSPDQRRGKETRLIAQHARSARTTAGIHLVTAKYDQQVDRRWQYQHSSSGLRSLAVAFARLRPPGPVLAKTKRRQCRCRLDSGEANHGRAPIPTKRNHGRHGKGSPGDRCRRNLSAGAGRLCFCPTQGHPTDRESGRKLCKRNPAPSCTGSSRDALGCHCCVALPTRIHSETAAASRVHLEPWNLLGTLCNLERWRAANAFSDAVSVRHLSRVPCPRCVSTGALVLRLHVLGYHNLTQPTVSPLDNHRPEVRLAVLGKSRT